MIPASHNRSSKAGGGPAQEKTEKPTDVQLDPKFMAAALARCCIAKQTFMSKT